MNRLPLPPLSPIVRLALSLLLISGIASANVTKHKRHAPVMRRPAALRATVRPASLTSRPALAAPVIAGGPWTEPTYADSTLGDSIDGEDLAIREAAAGALGDFNGSVGVGGSPP